MDFSYTYDNVGNITSETREGVTTTYSYDSLGQLTRVNDPHDTTSGNTGTTWVYNYDLGGNITSKVRYAYTTGTLRTALETIPYSYTDSNWKDKLTAYNGQAITYDAIGNPLNDGTWTYSWEAGRRLAQMSKSGTTVQYQYDANGLRVGKIVNGTETTYTLHGKLLTHLKQGANEMHFYYDAQSRPAMVAFNGAYYTYLHNLQGDIVGLVDSSNNIVVEYKYDAWGKPTLKRSLTTAYDTLATLNPFRYRGYVYDEETGLYYLRSRYYNPVRGRFVNFDKYISTDSVSASYNLYVYCCDNSINLYDPQGTFPWDLDWSIYGVAWNQLCKDIKAFFGCFEADVGVGIGGGFETKIMGIGAGSYVGCDIFRVAYEDGKNSLYWGPIVSSSISLGNLIGFTSSLDQKNTFGEVVEYNTEITNTLNIWKMQYPNFQQQIISLFDFSAGIGVGGHGSLGFNLTEYNNQFGNRLDVADLLKLVLRLPKLEFASDRSSGLPRNWVIPWRRNIFAPRFYMTCM